MPGDSAFVGGVADVAQDVRTGSNGLGVIPGLEVVAQGVHVRIGADSGVPEQVPGTADGRASLYDGVALGRAAPLQAVGGADAG